MALDLIDLLWREHPDAPHGGTRGPRSRVTTSATVEAAVALADAEGLAGLTVRRLATALQISTMAVYTHVGSRDDLLVLMVDHVHARAPRPPFPDTGWRSRVRRVAEDDRDVHLAHGWLLDVTDERSVLGPGSVAKYDHELHAFDELSLDDVTRDAALTWVLGFARSAARAARPAADPGVVADAWRQSAERLAGYLGDDHPLAQRVGSAAGAQMNAPSSARHAWTFGLERLLDGLAGLAERTRC